MCRPRPEFPESFADAKHNGARDRWRSQGFIVKDSEQREMQVTLHVFLLPNRFPPNKYIYGRWWLVQFGGLAC